MPPAVEYARRLIDGIGHLDGHGFLTSLCFANFHSLILIVMYWLALKNWMGAITENSPLNFFHAISTYGGWVMMSRKPLILVFRLLNDT